jgi:hypothetical protein
MFGIIMMIFSVMFFGLAIRHFTDGDAVMGVVCMLMGIMDLVIGILKITGVVNG